LNSVKGIVEEGEEEEEEEGKEDGTFAGIIYHKCNIWHNETRKLLIEEERV
jgi:hypothetical protein